MYVYGNIHTENVFAYKYKFMLVKSFLSSYVYIWLTRMKCIIISTKNKDVMLTFV